MNRVFLSGNLGQKPELRNAKTGLAICNFTVATNQRAKKDDEWVNHTDWHRIVVFGKQGEHCEKYLDKGAKVIVEGRIQYRSYEDKEGQRRFMTEIIADRVEFLTRPENGTSQYQEKPQARDPMPAEEIPF